MTLAAVIPMKTLSSSKSRLATSMGVHQRVSLSLYMLGNVLRAATESSLDRVLVVGSDDKVMDVAKDAGAEWVVDSGGGLNHELQMVFDVLSESDIASIYVPADLPFLETVDIEALIRDSDSGKLIALCPDNSDEGTNGLLIPPDIDFRPLLGHQSYYRHISVLEQLKLPYTVCVSAGWGLDIDSPKDLESLAEIHTDFKNQISAM